MTISSKYEKKHANEMAKIRVKCQCSHIMIFPIFGPDVKVCSYCGHKVYRNEKVKFKDNLLKVIKEKENDDERNFK